jgi:hypothetical protein
VLVEVYTADERTDSLQGNPFSLDGEGEDEGETLGLQSFITTTCHWNSISSFSRNN